MVYQQDILPEDKELLYDLRQAFVIITTEIKKQILIARTNKEYPAWYDLLDSLYIEVSKNLSDEEMEEYENLKNDSSKICSKYHLTYLRKESENSTEVYNALRKLDIWLNRKMNEKNMYGSKDMDDSEGL